jgi:hypothetical protein
MSARQSRCGVHIAGTSLGTASDFPQAVYPAPPVLIPGGYLPGQIRVMAHFKEQVRGTVEVQPLLV